MAAPMTDAEKQALLDLASRCETEEPSYDLDCKIEHACAPERAKYIGNARPYTTSRDAAAALMPEGMTVNVITGGDQGEMTYVEVFVSGDIHWCDAQADTEAQARSAAALRARAA